jgi:hypothetical protein
MLRHGLAFPLFRCIMSDERGIHRTLNIGRLWALWQTMKWILTQTHLALEQIGAEWNLRAKYATSIRS